MSIELNKAIVRRFFDEVCNQRKIKIIDKVFATDVNFNGIPGSSKKNVLQYLEAIWNAFGKNITVEVNKQLAEGNWVSTRRTWSGIPHKEFRGQAPDGRQVNWTEISVVRIEDDKIVEDWMVASNFNVPPLTDKQKDFLVKDYELKVRYLTDQFQRMWTRFNFFVTIETALVGSKLVFGSGMLTRNVALIGFFVSLIWYMIGAQDRHLVSEYRDHTKTTGELIREQILDMPKYQTIADTGAKNVFTSIVEWRFEAISTTKMAALIPLLLVVGWGIAYVLLK